MLKSVDCTLKNIEFVAIHVSFQKAGRLYLLLCRHGIELGLGSWTTGDKMRDLLAGCWMVDDRGMRDLAIAAL